MDQPFQFGIFLVASAIVILLTWRDVVSDSIRYALRLLEREAVDGTPLDDAFKAELRDQAERKTTGKVVGGIESQVYLYALVSSQPDIFAGVLAFKAFTGWLAIQAAEQSGGKSKTTLVRFYSYAIGNFLSLLWTVAVFEIVRWAVIYFPVAQSLLWINKSAALG